MTSNSTLSPAMDRAMRSAVLADDGQTFVLGRTDIKQATRAALMARGLVGGVATLTTHVVHPYATALTTQGVEWLKANTAIVEAAHQDPVQAARRAFLQDGDLQVEARGWLEDAGVLDATAAALAGPSTRVTLVERHYTGGLVAFVEAWQTATVVSREAAPVEALEAALSAGEAMARENVRAALESTARGLDGIVVELEDVEALEPFTARRDGDVVHVETPREGDRDAALEHGWTVGPLEGYTAPFVGSHQWAERLTDAAVELEAGEALEPGGELDGSPLQREALEALDNLEGEAPQTRLLDAGRAYFRHMVPDSVTVGRALIPAVLQQVYPDGYSQFVIDYAAGNVEPWGDHARKAVDDAREYYRDSAHIPPAWRLLLAPLEGRRLSYVMRRAIIRSTATAYRGEPVVVVDASTYRVETVLALRDRGLVGYGFPGRYGYPLTYAGRLVRIGMLCTCGTGAVAIDEHAGHCAALLQDREDRRASRRAARDYRDRRHATRVGDRWRLTDDARSSAIGWIRDALPGTLTDGWSDDQVVAVVEDRYRGGRSAFLEALEDGEALDATPRVSLVKAYTGGRFTNRDVSTAELHTAAGYSDDARRELDYRERVTAWWRAQRAQRFQAAALAVLVPTFPTTALEAWRDVLEASTDNLDALTARITVELWERERVAAWWRQQHHTARWSWSYTADIGDTERCARVDYSRYASPYSPPRPRTDEGYAVCYRCERSACSFVYLRVSSLTPVCRVHRDALDVELDGFGSLVERGPVRPEFV